MLTCWPSCRNAGRWTSPGRPGRPSRASTQPPAFEALGTAVASLAGRRHSSCRDPRHRPPADRPRDVHHRERVRARRLQQGRLSQQGIPDGPQQVGQEWIMLQAGLTLRKPAKDYKLKREHLSVTHARRQDDSARDAAGVPRRHGRRLVPHMRAKIAPDSINYFPNDVSRPSISSTSSGAPTGPSRTSRPLGRGRWPRPSRG